MKSLLAIFCLIALGFASATTAFSEGNATLRKNTPIAQEAQAPKLGRVENDDKKRVRNYPEQPPTIPHQIRDYEVTLSANKCLSCHNRINTEDTQAPMVSVTHFMDRDGQVLAAVSPRRYFCNQCHVTQVDTPPLIHNDFVDVDKMLNMKKAE